MDGSVLVPGPLQGAPRLRTKVVAVNMGYGHLRPAHALAAALGQQVFQADEPPLAVGADQQSWRRIRRSYEWISKASQMGGVLARPLRAILDGITSIPHLNPYRDLSGTTLGVRGVQHYMDQGMGKGLVEALRNEQAGLLTTFYAPAIIAAAAGIERVVCVVTDSDINRVWAPADTAHSPIEFCVPSVRARLRLQAYGVRPEKIHYTGFPLPGELLGGPDLAALRRNLAPRLVRLDPGGVFRDQARDELTHFFGELPQSKGTAPLITFAIGGAGSQSELALTVLRSLRDDLSAGRLRLALVAATHVPLRDQFHAEAKKLGLEDRLGRGLEILYAATFEGYLAAFNALLAETDVLFTKPSEMSFFAALGLPMVFSWPVGAQERYNRRWCIESGAGLKMRDPRFANEWLREWLEDGTLAGAAWSGFTRLPKFGLYRILELLQPPG